MRHQRIRRPDPRGVGLRDRVFACERWRTWADGDRINTVELAAAVQTLNDPRLHSVSPGHEKAGSVRDPLCETAWAAPGAGMFDRLTRWGPRDEPIREVKHVLCAGCRPQREE